MFFVENVDRSAQKKELSGGNTNSGNGKEQQENSMKERKNHTWDIDFETLIATADSLARTYSRIVLTPVELWATTIRP